MPDAAGVNEDLFVIPRGPDRYYLYGPLRRFIAVVNGAAVSAVGNYLAGRGDTLSAPAAALIEQLRQRGLFGSPAPRPPTFPAGYDFCPHEVTLFLTSRCNLRCRYCYADAGRKAIDMPWEVAQAAIDLVATNAGLLGAKKFAVGFHGGGEPTLAWDCFVRSVEYAQEKAEAMGLENDFFSATNGLLTPEKREFITKNFTTVTVSLDGPEEIQNFHRPTVGGQGSYQQVRETLQHFDQAGFNYGVRATITAAVVGRMVEIVERLHEEFNLEYLHMEPVWFCGRCTTSGEKPPDDETFAAHFLDALRRGEELGVRVIYSGARLGTLTCKFCAAPGDGFSVLPEGIATSCYEVTETSDPRAAIFHYGRYDPASGGFAFDRERITALQNLSVENLPFCRDCFCKWHCAGDCLAKVFEKSGSDTHRGSIRCNLNRTLTLSGLDQLVAAEQAEAGSPPFAGDPVA